MTQRKPEQDLSNASRLEIGSASDVRLFRNNVGTLLDSRGIPVSYGLLKGSADTIGVVGPFGRFLSIEYKRDFRPLSGEQWAHVREARVKRADCKCARCHQARQEDWRDMINRFGGVAGIVDSVEGAKALAEEARKPHSSWTEMYMGHWENEKGERT